MSHTLRKFNHSIASFRTLKRAYSVNMTSNKFKLGLCQMIVGDDKAKNLKNASNAIQKAVDKGADIIVLPVMFYHICV